MDRTFVPCLVCDPELRRVPEIEFLNHLHMGPVHDPGDPETVDEYRAWVAEEYELDPDHPVFQESGALTRPDAFVEYEHLFERDD